MDISFGGDSPAWVPILSVIVSLFAIGVTSGIAIYGILDARHSRKRAHIRELVVATRSIKHTLELLKLIYQNIQEAPPQQFVHWGGLSAFSEPAFLAANQLLARNIPDRVLYDLAVNTQTLAATVRQDISVNQQAQLHMSALDWLEKSKPLAQSRDQIAHTLDEVMNRLSVRYPDADRLAEG